MKMRRRAKVARDAMMCGHANEVPRVCLCAPDCYCVGRTCEPDGVNEIGVLNQRPGGNHRADWPPARGLSGTIRVIDPAVNPDHYNAVGMEAWDVIEAFGLGYHLGAALKYILRCGKKGPPETDIDKAIRYLQRYRDHVLPKSSKKD